ncbi:MAG: hypothetical protein IVW36_02330 [Dehalococcoidia bacterium]|nr:hypothetical protein [Dehalococcoidia bacterium]
MQFVSGHRTGSWRRPAVVAVFAFVAFLAIGARCIDRTSERVDSSGYTHISGEMVNDTNIQGKQIMLRARLLDGQGNVVAQKDGPTCPPDAQPNQQTMFDLRFDNPNVPPHASYDVRPISGITLPQPLPRPQVVVLQTAAVRYETNPPFSDLTNKDVLFAFNIRNQSDQSYSGIQGCTAVYDQSGNIVFGSSDELTQQSANGAPEPATLGPQNLVSVFMEAKDVPVGPVQVRAWLWFGPKGAPTSSVQFISTPFITIQTIP